MMVEMVKETIHFVIGSFRHEWPWHSQDIIKVYMILIGIPNSSQQRTKFK